MKRSLAGLGALVLVGSLPAWALQDGPAAIVVRVNGPVQVEQPNAAPRLATVGTRLNIGDRIRPATGASAVILRRTGAKFTINQPTVLEAPRSESDEPVFTRALRTLAQASSTAAREQPNRQGMIRPIPGTAVPVAPRNGIAVLGPRPTFRWFAVPGATGYRIQIQRAGGGTPMRYDAGTDTVWTLPADAPPLVPGETYRWTVGAEPSGRVAQPQTFRVIDAAGYAALAEALAAITEAGFDPAGDGLFLAALAYRDAGLYYEAERALALMERSGTALGRDFYLLHGEVYDALGNLDAARAAFDKAAASQ